MLPALRLAPAVSDGIAELVVLIVVVCPVAAGGRL
ncbi:hypothetical protein SEEU8388_13136 [Salmonella enterica subsp. enterica serovar Muenchen str. ATCC 8388]|nr:hypothetical protein SE451239_23063 [Salmonella enterica subsp. enterica serovar 4 [Salmonella enterica subsp. enterica serovar 4 [Salmonella enterica subsp. enterica serovar 4,[5],12:i:- str. 08-1739]ELX32821.1 hypothetical protein SE451200_06574 [Salmonella enterica subsp. enterica serovar 4 [Salmonella enterica subsp. enterica serovar 4 [Salmonella enterica subsp. enterica serovar 4,[5],12:i:- str. 08-1700]ELX38813.1 hypothetical protein SEET1153_01972 [Salmonella enterica subsp. enterica s